MWGEKVGRQTWSLHLWILNGQGTARTKVRLGRTSPWRRGGGRGRVASRSNLSQPLAIVNWVTSIAPIPHVKVVNPNNKNFAPFWHLFNSNSEHSWRMGRYGPRVPQVGPDRFVLGRGRPSLHYARPGLTSWSQSWCQAGPQKIGLCLSLLGTPCLCMYTAGKWTHCVYSSRDTNINDPNILLNMIFGSR